VPGLLGIAARAGAVELPRHPGHNVLMARPKRRQGSSVRKRAIYLSSKTSVSLEDAFWSALKEIAAAKNTNVRGLIREIDKKRQHGNLSSAIRLFILEYYRERAR